LFGDQCDPHSVRSESRNFTNSKGGRTEQVRWTAE
jgi:hypothetical protein